MDKRHLLLYNYVENMLERRAPHREAHLAKIAEQKDAGRIVMSGPLGDPEPTGAAIVFGGEVSREDVEAFVNDDPYVQAGLVTAWMIEPWTLV